VKFFGWFRGSNGYADKFYDSKANKPITEEDVGERDLVCAAIAKIPCAMKPHAYRILFDEPKIHIYNTSEGTGAYKGLGNIDIGNVMANLQLSAEFNGKSVSSLEGLFRKIVSYLLIKIKYLPHIF